MEGKRCRDGDTAKGMEQEWKGRDVGMGTLKGWSRKGGKRAGGVGMGTLQNGGAGLAVTSYSTDTTVDTGRRRKLRVISATL